MHTRVSRKSRLVCTFSCSFLKAFKFKSVAIHSKLFISHWNSTNPYKQFCDGRAYIFSASIFVGWRTRFCVSKACLEITSTNSSILLRGIGFTDPCLPPNSEFLTNVIKFSFKDLVIEHEDAVVKNNWSFPFHFPSPNSYQAVFFSFRYCCLLILSHAAWVAKKQLY